MRLLFELRECGMCQFQSSIAGNIVNCDHDKKDVWLVDLDLIKIILVLSFLII